MVLLVHPGFAGMDTERGCVVAVKQVGVHLR